jgi:hypothetical protein
MTRFIVAGLLFITGCAIFQSGPSVRSDFQSAEVLRSQDEAGVSRNDQCTLHDQAQLAQLEGFFPDLMGTRQSTLNAQWIPWIIIRFHSQDGTVTYVNSDYRIYRVNDGLRGDFVVKSTTDFADFVEHLPMSPYRPN